MNDISYEILDLFKKYGADKQGIQKILEADSRPEVLYALSADARLKDQAVFEYSQSTKKQYIDKLKKIFMDID